MCVTKTLAAAALLVISMAGHCWGYSSGLTIGLSCESVWLPTDQHSPPPSAVTLQCTVEGVESGGLTIEWTTPNNITLNSTTIDNKFSVYQIDAGSNTTLTGLNVSRLSYLDQGSYQCRVVSRAGGQGVVLSSTVTTSLDLELITTLNVSIEQPPGKSSAELSCEMSDYIRPDDHLSWYHGNQPVDTTDNRRTLSCSQGSRLDAQFGGEKNTHNRVCVLRIERVMPGDVGMYTCRVGPKNNAVVISQPLTLLEDPAATGTTLPSSMEPTADSKQTPPTTPTLPTPTISLHIVIPVVVAAALLLLTAVIIVAVVVLVKKCQTRQKHRLFSSSELRDSEVLEAQPSDTATSPNVSYGTQPSDTATSPNVSYGTQPSDTATSPNVLYGTQPSDTATYPNVSYGTQPNDNATNSNVTHRPRESSPDTDFPSAWIQSGTGFAVSPSVSHGVRPHPSANNDSEHSHPVHTSDALVVSTDDLNGVLHREVCTTSPNISYGVQPAKGLPSSTATTQRTDGGESLDPLYESIRSMHHYIMARPPDDDPDDDYYVNESLGPWVMRS